MSRKPLPLDDREIHVWYARPERIADAQLEARCLAVLSADEARRQQRFMFARHRQLYLAAHALVRCVLSRYADVPPADWQFETNEYGRPEIAASQAVDGLTFNLSHTEGLVALAVGRHRDLGVDVEHVDRRQIGVELADRYFAPSEVRDLLARPEEQQQRAFFDYWTLKEAYIKARGMGLAIPLDQFAYRLCEGEPITIAIDPRLADDAESWQFEQHVPWPRHVLSLAARRSPEERAAAIPLVTAWRETVPDPAETAGDDAS